MKVSLTQVKQFIDFDLPPVDELVSRINQQLGGVEEVIDLGAKYKDARIVRVVECEKHPNADRLNVTKIDDGGVTENIERDENGYIQVVCGAPNVHADMFAVWLAPHSIVPSTFDDAEPFTLGSRELRGVMSHGMLAAGDELGINSDHDGIIQIDASEWRPYGTKIEPGASFAKAYGLDDYVIDIENKMFTHRPDLFGQLGVAREIAGILGRKFTSPKWYLDKPKFETGAGLELETFNDAGENVQHVMFAAMKNAEIKPSPLWLQTALVAMGGKPINNVVDITNYVMLLTAQPTHAYDYDKLRGHKIGARMARDGEKIKLLNGKTYELTSDDIVIADSEGPIGLGGIMGGGDSEVDENTNNIVLEVATFDMYAVRKSAMRHGVFTDALTRFNKGQSPLQNDHIMNILLMSMKDVSSAEQASEVFDQKIFIDQFDDDHFNGKYEPASIEIDSNFINARLGLKLSDKEICELLENVEIHSHSTEESSSYLCTQNPFWRTDIELPEDVVEEVGRLYGFDKLPRELPRRSIAPAAKNKTREVADTVRRSMKRIGANEVLTYSFVHENTLKQSEQNADEAFRLSNALSPNLQYYRLSVLPSILDKAYGNIRAGHDEFVLYEIGKAHHNQMFDDDGLPKEFRRIAGVYVNKAPAAQSPYFQVTEYVRTLIADFNVSDNLQFEKLSDFDAHGHKSFDQLVKPFDAERSSMVMLGDAPLGAVGEFKPNVLRGFKLPENSAGFELFPSALENIGANRSYRPLSRFPSVMQDISLRGSSNVSYGDIWRVAQSALDEQGNQLALTIDVSPLAIYVGDDTSTKTTTFRLKFTSHEHTLTDDMVKPFVDAVAEKAQQELSLDLV